VNSCAVSSGLIVYCLRSNSGQVVQGTTYDSDKWRNSNVYSSQRTVLGPNPPRPPSPPRSAQDASTSQARDRNSYLRYEMGEHRQPTHMTSPEHGDGVWTQSIYHNAVKGHFGDIDYSTSHPPSKEGEPTMASASQYFHYVPKRSS
jgi:hypothetical protein